MCYSLLSHFFYFKFQMRMKRMVRILNWENIRKNFQRLLLLVVAVSFVLQLVLERPKFLWTSFWSTLRDWKQVNLKKFYGDSENWSLRLKCKVWHRFMPFYTERLFFIKKILEVKMMFIFLSYLVESFKIFLSVEKSYLKSFTFIKIAQNCGKKVMFCWEKK